MSINMSIHDAVSVAFNHCCDHAAGRNPSVSFDVKASDEDESQATRITIFPGQNNAKDLAYGLIEVGSFYLAYLNEKDGKDGD